MSETLRQIYDHAVAAGTLSGDPGQITLLAPLQSIRDALDLPVREKRGVLQRGKPPRVVPGLYIWGGVGRGKSMLMDMFFANVATPEKRRVHFHAFLQEVHADLHLARRDDIPDPLHHVAAKIATGLRLLCFDEMQIGDITDAMIVGRLFALLMAQHVTIVATSNRPPDDLYKDGLQRELFLPFIDTLKAHMVVHHLVSATDYRQNRLSGSQVYFTPSDAAARAAMQKIWCDLTGGQGAPLAEKLLAPVAYPLFILLINTMIKPTSNNVENGLKKVRDIIKTTDDLLAKGNTYLLDDNFSAADLALACMLAPLVWPGNYGIRLPEPEDLSAAAKAVVDEFRNTATGEYVLKLYETERTTTTISE